MDEHIRPAVAEDAGGGGLQILVTAGPARFVADEPVAIGGLDLGPSPHELVAAALAACTAQTLRLYANRKQWPLGAVHVEALAIQDPAAAPPDEFRLTVTLGGALDGAQRTRLMEIAHSCPIHRLLAPGARISTTQA